MFESYEKTSERKVLKIGLLVILAFICWVTLIQLAWTTREDSAAAIERSELLKAHDRMCLELPRPADFQLRYKSIAGNNFTRSISYNYISKMYYAEVRDFYKVSLPPLGWVLSDQYELEMSPIPKHISFEKDKYRIALEHVSATGSSSPGEYSIYCARILN